MLKYDLVMTDFENGKCKIAVSDDIGRLRFLLEILSHNSEPQFQQNRYLIAAKPLKQGDLLLCEQPVIIGPYWGSELCCLTCYKRSSKICR